MTRISVLRAPDRDGNDSVAVILSQNAMFVNVDGDPFPGVALNVAQAREVARRLLLLAQEIEDSRIWSLSAGPE